MRILMLGNSFTTTHHLPELLSSLTGAEVRTHTRGGARLSEHLNPGTRLGARTQAALRDEAWDFVILQEMSNAPITSPERFRESVTTLSTLIRSHGAQPILYGTWAYQSGCPRLEALHLTFAEMADAMSRSSREAAQTAGIPLADVGAAFRMQNGTAALYGPDGVHPSELGARIAAETLAETIASLSREVR